MAWFKACAPVQAFEPRLTAEPFARYPDRVVEVLGHDEERAWLLLGDAGTPIGALGNPPETWLVALRLYAELRRGEVAHTFDHLAHGVPDLRVATPIWNRWGRGLDGAFALAMRVGAFAHAIAWLRQRDHLSAMERAEFDRGFPIVLRRAIIQTL